MERAGRAAAGIGRRRIAVDRRLLRGATALIAGLLVTAAPAGIAFATTPPPSTPPSTTSAPSTSEPAPSTSEPAPTTSEPSPSSTAAPTTSEAAPASTEPAPSTSDAATSAPVPPLPDQASSGPIAGATTARPSARPSTGATSRPATAPAAAPAISPTPVGGADIVVTPRPATVPAAGQVASGAIGLPTVGPAARPTGIPNVFTLAQQVSQWKLVLLIAVMSGLGAAVLLHLGRRDQAAMDAIHLDLMLGLERESPEPPRT